MPDPIEKDLRLKQDLMKIEMDKLARSRNEEMLLRSDKRSKEKGYTLEQWDKLNKSSDQMIEEGQKGFDNFIAVMCSMMMHCKKVERALHASFLDYTGECFNFIIDTFSNDYDERKIKLPALVQTVTFSDENKLEAGSIKRNLMFENGQPITDEQQELFDIAVKSWLNHIGYESNPLEPGVFKQGDRQLDKQTFEALRDDHYTGLAAYLSDKLELTINNAPPTQPRL